MLCNCLIRERCHNAIFPLCDTNILAFAVCMCCAILNPHTQKRETDTKLKHSFTTALARNQLTSVQTHFSIAQVFCWFFCFFFFFFECVLCFLFTVVRDRCPHPVTNISDGLPRTQFSFQSMGRTLHHFGRCNRCARLFIYPQNIGMCVHFILFSTAKSLALSFIPVKRLFIFGIPDKQFVFLKYTSTFCITPLFLHGPITM